MLMVKEKVEKNEKENKVSSFFTLFLMDPYIIPKLEKFFFKLREFQLNIFLEQNIGEVKEMWEEYKSEPLYIDFMEQKFAAGEYTTPQQVRDDYDRYLATAEQAIEKFPDNNKLIFHSIVGMFQTTTREKLEKALRNEIEDTLYQRDKLIEETQRLLNNLPSGIYMDEPEMRHIDTFGLPRKIFPNFEI